MVSYKKDKCGNLIFEGGKIQEVVLEDLIEAINFEFKDVPHDEIVFSTSWYERDNGKLRLGPRQYDFQTLPNKSIHTIIPQYRTLSQVTNAALRFPNPTLNEIIVFWGTQGELCVCLPGEQK